MEFSQEPVPVVRSQRSIALHGPDTPFRPLHVYTKYVQDLVNRRGYRDLVEYNTTVERASKKNGEWELVLRRSGDATDYWWKEYFDAVVVATGHYTVPYFPLIEGLQEFENKYPGSVIHTKAFRGAETFRGKVRCARPDQHPMLLTAREESHCCWRFRVRRGYSCRSPRCRAVAGLRCCQGPQI